MGTVHQLAEASPPPHTQEQFVVCELITDGVSPDSLPMRLIRQLEDGALSRQPRTACECCYTFNDNRLGNGA